MLFLETVLIEFAVI